MNQVVKTCIHHGDLTEEQVRRDKERIRCRICLSEKRIAYKDKKKAWSDANREKINKQQVERRKKNLEYYKERERRYTSDPEYKVHAAEWARQDRRDNPEKYAAQKRQRRLQENSKIVAGEIRRKYGLSKEQFDEMVKRQNNRCAICHQEETRPGRTPGTIMRLCIDHDHETNITRELLCDSCNLILGLLKHSVEKFQEAILSTRFYSKRELFPKMIEYLKKHKESK